MQRVPAGYVAHHKPRHVAGLELIVLSLLLLRVVRALPPAMAALILCTRHFCRQGKRMFRRLALWRDRHWRRPRYVLRCDLSAVEPGTCPVCLAPLAGPPFADEDEAEEPQADDVEVDGLEANLTAADALSTSSLGARAGEVPPANLFRLRCGHTFHAACLNDWIDRRGTCPLCRADVGDNREWVELLSLDTLSAPFPARDVVVRQSNRTRSPAVEEANSDIDVEAGDANEPMLHGETCDDAGSCHIPVTCDDTNADDVHSRLQAV